MENNVALNNTSILDGNIDGQILKSQQLFSSVFRGLVLAVKVTILFTLSFIYSVIALTAFILYQIFFKRLVNMIVKKIRQDKPAPSYSYNWKKHHPDLNWEA